ncbi:hypothetical protein T281_06640 [Rhodomicrobium udaipurense JA643]|nr:hypothetical protein T281_06640 [Rhodomicrobium udaipurense JA643]
MRCDRSRRALQRRAVDAARHCTSLLSRVRLTQADLCGDLLSRIGSTERGPDRLLRGHFKMPMRVESR